MTYITLPNGKACGIGTYARAWRYLMQASPNEILTNWGHFSVTARGVRREMLSGLMDRISRHDRTTYHNNLSDRRLFTKIRNAALRGAIRYECRNCGTALDPLTVNPNNQQSRYCDASCRSF